MEALWEKLPDAQKVLEGKATPEDYAVTGAYKELEKLEKFIEENLPKSPFEVLEEKIKIDDETTVFEGEPLDVDEEILFKDN
jgi:hypothetical protein